MGRENTMLGVPMLAGVVLAGAVMLGCASVKEAGPSLELFVIEQLGRWTLTPAWRTVKPWTLTDGVYQAPEASWVGYGEVFDDFVLECEFLFHGTGQGGIVIRGDRESLEPWAVGYELDIDWAPDRKHGHVHFPVHPEPYVGDAPFEVGVWHTARIEARGESVTVFLDRKRVLHFVDGSFRQGHICLEGQPGGVEYRNLRIRRIGS